MELTDDKNSESQGKTDTHKTVTSVNALLIECLRATRWQQDDDTQTASDCSDERFSIVDSGASANIFALDHIKMFSHPYEHNSYVACANDQIMQGHWAADNGLLQGVLFHNTTKNLISVSKLIEAGCDVNLGKVNNIKFKNLEIRISPWQGLFYLNKNDTIRLMNCHFAGTVQYSRTRTPAIPRQIPSWLRRDLNKNKSSGKNIFPIVETSDETVLSQPDEEKSENNIIENDSTPQIDNDSFMRDTEGDNTLIEETSETSHQHNSDEVNENARSDTTPKETNRDTRDIMTGLTKDPVYAAHQRWGHVGIAWMKQMALLISDLQLKTLILKTQRINCPTCAVGKIKAKKRGKVSKNRSDTPFKKIALDWIGKLNQHEHSEDDSRQTKGFFLAVDYCTNFLMIYPANSKDEAPVAIDYFIQEILKLGLRVSEVRTDSGREFVSRRFAKVLNPYYVAHTTSVAGQQWQNGKCERSVQTVLDMSRCLLADAGLPDSLWIQAARHATLIINNLVVKGQDKSPRQLVGLPRLELHDIPRFGQFGVSRNTTISGNTQPRGEACIFLTILNEKDDRYLVMLKDSGQIVKRENVTFFEDIIHSEITEMASIAVALIATNQPASIKAALKSADKLEWIKAIQKEADNLKLHATLEEVKGFVNAKILGSFIILKKVITNEGLIKYKARLVAMGNRQEIDPDESVFAPTCALGVNLLLDNIAINFGYKVAVMDIAAAFLKGRNTKEEYISVPMEFAKFLGAKRNIFRIAGNLYGTRQAPSIWFNTFSEMLIKLGFTQSNASLTLFTRGEFASNNSIILSIYVDDVKILYRTDRDLNEFKKQIDKVYTDTKFNIKFSKFLGISYLVEDKCISLNHEDYIESNIKPLVDYENDKIYKLPKLHINEDGSNTDIENCLQLAGIMRFIADRARMDIQFHTNEIMSGLYKDPLNLLKAVARYLVFTKSRKAKFKKGEQFSLTSFCDASHLRTADSRSRIAVAIFCNDSSAPFFSFSSKTSDHFTTISVSSCEAEVKAIYEATVAIEFFVNILRSINVKCHKIPTIKTDNLSAITIIKNGEGNSKLRHINTRILYVHHLVKNGLISLEKVPTEENRVDFLTKYFTSSKFEAAAERFLGQ